MDFVNTMGIPADDAYAKFGEPPAWAEFRAIAKEAGVAAWIQYNRDFHLALARACGKQDVHHLEPEDLVALTVEAAAMAQVPLAGTSWIPGQTD